MFGQQFLKILVLTAGIIALASGFQLIFASPNEPLTSKPELSVKEKQKAFNKICGAIASSDYFSGAVLVADNSQVIYRKAFGLANRDFSLLRYMYVLL